MKKQAVALGLGLTFAFASPFASSALGIRTGLVTEMQMSSHVRAGDPNVAWLRLPGSWSGVTCGTDWAWFNADEDPHLLATLLAARATGSALTIAVDDALPKMTGWCHVTYIHVPAT